MGRLDVKTREFQTQRGEISKRNYYIISSRVLIKAIIIITASGRHRRLPGVTVRRLTCAGPGPVRNCKPGTNKKSLMPRQ